MGHAMKRKSADPLTRTTITATRGTTERLATMARPISPRGKEPIEAVILRLMDFWQQQHPGGGDP